MGIRSPTIYGRLVRWMCLNNNKFKFRRIKKNLCTCTYIFKCFQICVNIQQDYMWRKPFTKNCLLPSDLRTRKTECTCTSVWFRRIRKPWREGRTRAYRRQCLLSSLWDMCCLWWLSSFRGGFSSHRRVRGSSTTMASSWPVSEMMMGAVGVSTRISKTSEV